MDFETGTSEAAAMGNLQLTYSPIRQLNNPEYARHFTLSRFEQGAFSLLTYPDFTKWTTLFHKEAPVSAGYYMLVTGSRLADGSVLCQLSCFDVPRSGNTVQPLVMRDNSEAIRVIGSFNSEALFTLAETGEETSILKVAGRGLFVLGVLGVGQEPTDHTLKDIAVKAKEYDACGRKMILLFQDEAQYRKYLRTPVAGLPDNVIWGIDSEGKIYNELLQALELPRNTSLPIFIIGDTFNRVIFNSCGYTIGLGEQLLKVIQSLPAES